MRTGSDKPKRAFIHRIIQHPLFFNFNLRAAIDKLVRIIAAYRDLLSAVLTCCLRGGACVHVCSETRRLVSL